LPDKILQYTPFLLAHIGCDLHYISTSQSYAALLGLTSNEIIGKRVADVVGAEGFEVMRPHIEAVLAGERVEYEADIKVADVEPRQYHTTLIPERNQQNKVVGYVVSVIDLSERNRVTEEKIRLERLVAQLSLPLEKARVGIFDLDMRTGIVSCTPELEAIFGLEATGLKSYAEYRKHVHPDDVHDVLTRRDEAIEAHKPYQLEYRIVRPDGQIRWVITVAGAVYDKVTNEPVRLMGSCFDITDLKANEIEVERQRSELAHLMRVATLGGLSGGIAHELSQPLASILANAQAAELMLAKKDPDLAGVTEALKEIIQDDYRAGQLIRRLRQLLQKQEYHVVPIGLNELITSTLQLLHFELSNRKIKVDTELKSALPPISGDLVGLQQVLINLIMNAIEAMASFEPSRRTLSIVTDETKEGYVAVSIRDQGPGMSPNELKRIFAPFFTTKTGGLGLGLSICSTIVTLHHGQLTLRNAPEGGMVATVLLPKDIQLAIAS
jgi:PAS domain S-box-containing protein